MSRQLSFREDGTFTIVQFTDLHWKNGEPEDQHTRAIMERTLDEEQPDMVVFTGDVIYTGPVSPGVTECQNPEQAFRDAVSCVEQRGIPWGVVFGNHDTEQHITREELMQVVITHKHTIAESGPKEITGEGNYTIELVDAEGKPAANLYFLDSGNESPLEHVPYYNWIQRDQIQWLVNESGRLNPDSQAPKLPALAFFHIPVPEYQEVWDTQTCYGHKHERVCCAPVNSGLFTALLEMGDVVGTFCGHDHVNDFEGTLHGIRLCYGRASGFSTYGKKGFKRGARVIRLTAGKSDFSTWLRLEDGSVVSQQPAHHPGDDNEK
ncbi:metallophosphoesterase family protein [Paenibacillus sp.]|jgi:predicted MPP superfamily phosphohydrolase|uniref:metallophosphoesterase family protein n=1 Tax=Paenibacillus sp. TaxID=58172 RepID=UPI00281B6A77|nr:metallophosphoesterase family protein [Paenibacillus sp.]MDR0270807.1 metallophosphoesterase family protein [Paenibacillus sp.]